ncbi:histidine kinase N-terminal 7TM domain-containing protein [Halobaculum roseum]|uniref:Histidine kinase N-terminal 7TM domain-containing protein n=1 Tax=Halobaculum roseum TaxID=2175149 RepID=A0ABD5MT70_9EURY|nr:histidine kinase N-terminal 7TM domain-containing protein [Halobaculum roseum]QZY02150.1 PAS domain-containing protein [Halobaculum roseum]
MSVGLGLFAGAILAGVGSAALVRLLFRYRSRPGATWLAVVFAGQAVFCVATAVGMLGPDRGVRIAIEAVAWVGIAGLAVPFLTFALAYSGRGALVRRRAYRLLWLFPATIVSLAVVTPATGALWRGFRTVPTGAFVTVRYDLTPVGEAVWLAGIGIIAAGTVVLLDTARRYELYRTEITAIVASTVPPVVPALLWSFGVGDLPYLNLLAVAFAAHVAVDAYAIHVTDMFEVDPTARRLTEAATLDHLDSPVVLVDDAGRIVRVNPAAATAFDVDPSATLKRGVDDVVGTDIDPNRDDQTVSVHAGDGRRTFAVSPTAVRDGTGGVVGYSVVFQDITAQRTRQQRLAVLNRVLRHNIRNDLNVVLGNVQLAREAAAGDDETAHDGGDSDGNGSDEDWSGRADLAAAERRAADLLSVAEDARVVDELVGGTDDPVPVSVADALADAVAEAEAERSVTVSVESNCPAAAVDPEALRTVVARTVSALVDRLDGRIAVAAGAAGPDAVAVAFRGDGSVPAHEIDALTNGRETPLEHADDLDLWVARWGADAIGASLSFAPDGGSRTVADGGPAAANGGADGAWGDGGSGGSGGSGDGGGDGGVVDADGAPDAVLSLPRASGGDGDAGVGPDDSAGVAGDGRHVGPRIRRTRKR